ncbi:hypothetical protein [Sphingosinicella sp. BN140058]|uniref:hypothetical protein n=1 Tax=Sphingosinicella sp. BN140058 TaxID=1892855 RepID=UPI0010139332|nr:hypothetical protein [Sphingosinicella sp. BN140058]QAY80205.1 hypothetical protein ETR14_26545 [Sphingosinicella sp. BN140058]
MTVYSFKGHAHREKQANEPKLITISQTHPLNNAHRPPYANGPAAARALLAHAQRELADPAQGAEYFAKLRSTLLKGAGNDRGIDARLRARSQRAISALSNNDVELTEEQIQFVPGLIDLQARLAAKLLPLVATTGQQAETVIDQVDSITRDALRAATHMRPQLDRGEEPAQVSDWQRDLIRTLATAPGIDHSDDEQLVADFDKLIFQLEQSLPIALDRDEPLYEIDDTLDPAAVAATVDALEWSGMQGALADDVSSFVTGDDELTQQARDAVYANMSMDEREFAATKIALRPSDRINMGMQVVNSFPSTIKLPEPAIEIGRFDVRMASEEEAQVMNQLLRWADQQKAYPGPEAAHSAVEAMKQLPLAAGEQGRFTVGLAVANNEASIAHAESFLAASAKNPDMRVIIHADIPSVRDRLIEARRQALVEAGREPTFADASDANRNFGGWTLRDNGADRFLGEGAHDSAIFVANVDKVMIYNTANDLSVGSIERARSEAISARKALEAQEAALREATAAGKTAEVSRLTAVVSGATKAKHSADVRLGTLKRQQADAPHRMVTPGDMARATIVDLAYQQGKLQKVFIPAEGQKSAVVQTKAGDLADQNQITAHQKARALLRGEEHDKRQMRDIFTQAGIRTGGAQPHAVLVDGSNWFQETKGAKKGFDALRDRINAISPTTPILTSNNAINPISKELIASGRPVIHATAWRVSESSRPIGPNGKPITVSERRTELDLGRVTYKAKEFDPKQNKDVEVLKTRHREFTAADLKGAVVVIRGGGSMEAATWDAVRKQALLDGKAGNALSPADAYLAAEKAWWADQGAKIVTPKEADDKLGRAIMQEALVDYASQAVLATDMGKDYHSANLIRLAADADKLASVTGKDGNAIPLQTAYDHSLQFSQTIVDNTLNAIKKDMAEEASSDYAQAILSKLPGVTPARAQEMGEVYGTLNDIYRAAEAGEASAALPKALHHELALANTWKNAVENVAHLGNALDNAGLDGIAVGSPDYPATVRESGRSDMIYARGDIDLNIPTIALVVGGDTKPSPADQDAARAVATEANEKGWAVSIHLSGETSARVAKSIAELPEAERPRILLVGDGVPRSSDVKLLDAVRAVEKAGGGFVTPTAPIVLRVEERPKTEAEVAMSGPETKTDPMLEKVYAADRRSALDLQGRQASAVVVVKSSGNDMEMVALKSALQAGRPVGALGPSDPVNPTVDDLRYRTADYSANRRLLAGGDRVSVMLENRHLAFQPNFIPDMTADAKQVYVPFEGSSEGKSNDRLQNRDAERDATPRGELESGGRIRTEIAWREPAQFIANGRGTGDFISKVESGEIRPILATEVDIAAQSRRNDERFLDSSNAMLAADAARLRREQTGQVDVRSDVKAVFAEVNDSAREAIDAETQSHFLAQRAALSR